METKALVRFLKSKHAQNATFLDKIKIAYRPYVCPFDDLLKTIPMETSVFDIGCGSGMLLSLIAKFRNPLKIAGCEITEHLVENANEVLADFDRKKLIVFDGKSIPEEIKDYEYITMIDVLHHIPKKEQLSFLKTLFNTMKVGSTLILKDIKGESILSHWNKFHDLLLSGEVGHEMNSKELEKFFIDNLELQLIKREERRMLLYPHFTLVVKKTK